jgi:hypothetical protein
MPQPTEITQFILGQPLRLNNVASRDPFGSQYDRTLKERRRDADAFYKAITPARVNQDAANVMRQGLSGMLWSKQYFFLDADKWLEEHGADPMRRSTPRVRNHEWFHMISGDLFSMPDKWEYPWFAAWDLAFHAMALSTIDIDFAKQQMDLLLEQAYLHPTGQIPAYEWNFSDVNPPVQAWATIFLYRMEQALRGKTDLDFLKRVFGKLTANFGWWINRKDRSGNNLYEGGFLGLDNIGVFDRSAPLPTGGIWNRPTVQRGLPCSVKTCSRSRTSWPLMIRPTRTWRQTLVSSSC